MLYNANHFACIFNNQTNKLDYYQKQAAICSTFVWSTPATFSSL